VTHAADVRLPEQEASSEAAIWARAHWVHLAAGLAIAASLWLKGVVLGHSFFRVDDYIFIYQSLHSRLTWAFLGRTYDGHLMPGSYLLVWALQRLSVYDWTLVSIVDMALLAAASLALYRLLRALFGARPAILLPLAVYLFSAIMAPGLGFWATALQWLPTQLAICMAITAHIGYLRTGRIWHAAHAVAWIVFGLAFDELNALVPLLLFALTSAFLVPAAAGGWGRSALATLRQFWRAWAGYLVVGAGYVLLYLHQLPTSYQQPGKPGQFSSVLATASSFFRLGFIPAALGGPWRWHSFGDFAVAAQAAPVTQLAWSVAGLVVLASLWYRRHALRGWLILLVWVFLTAVIPVTVGRVGQGINPVELGSDLHYLADSLPVLAICAGLAFWPAAGEADPYRAHPPPVLRQAGLLVLTAVYLTGSVWSYQRYDEVVSTKAVRSYFATARAAVAAAPAGAVLVNTAVPTAVTPFGAQTSVLLAPLTAAAPGQHLTWARINKQLSGVLPDVLAFDGQGRLRPVLLYTALQLKPPAKAKNNCWMIKRKGVTIQLGSKIWSWPWQIVFQSAGPASELTLTFAGRTHDIAVPAGSHTDYVPATGSGSVIRAQLVSGGPAVCLSGLEIGDPGKFVPSIVGQAVPAQPVRG
jgi:hypothetical protein